MEDIDLTGLRVFREIVASGSFAAAAERLGLSPPMVSRHLARLERRLGARLLHRSNRRLSLTEAGGLLLEQGGRALDLLEGALAAVGEAGGPHGELKISAPVWCGAPVFARLLRDYRAAHPAVRLDLHLDSRIVDIVAEGFDLALRTTAKVAPTLIARPLCRIGFRLVATPGFRAGQDANGLPVIDMVLPNHVERQHLRSPGAARVETAMRSNDTHLTHQAVLAGLGAAFLPDWIADDDLAAGRLVVLEGPESRFERPVFAVYASRRHMPTRLRSFIDFLAERLGPRPLDA